MKIKLGAAEQRLVFVSVEAVLGQDDSESWLRRSLPRGDELPEISEGRISRWCCIERMQY